VRLTPYFDRNGIAVYHERWEDVLAAGLVPIDEVALIHGDPPYGVKEQTNRASRKRGVQAGSVERGNNVGGRGRPQRRDFPPVVGDDRPYDPSPLLALSRPTVLWGANHYAERLPASPSWLLWDKRDGVATDDNADGELAWTNLGGPLRIFRHLWRGTCRASETGVVHLGPTQKPIALCTWVYKRAGLKRGDLVFVPCLGTGPDLPAARALGLRVIACDVEEWCCRTAVGRLREVPRPEPAAALGPLFARHGGAS
jgi:site-specific DNA-methyltransferase (adenine-specific)/modification methylase